MDKEIDLGRKMGEEMPTTMPREEVMYPQFHITGAESLGLPKSGTMEIEFQRVSETSRKGADGKETYDCTIEVRKILECDCDKGPKAPSTRDKSAEEALDTLAAAVGRKKSESKPEPEEY